MNRNFKTFWRVWALGWILAASLFGGGCCWSGAARKSAETYAAYRPFSDDSEIVVRVSVSE